jgi:hypothetical protein
VVRARRNAFELKSSAEDPSKLQMPFFQVEDSTLVEVYETRNDLQRSLARNAFSRRSIETNLSAGDFGVNVGPLWRRDAGRNAAATDSTDLREQEYYAAYIYPRARIFLDQEELQISQQCQMELTDLERRPSLQALNTFYRRYGHVFVTSVLLGGQQKTTKFAGAVEREDNARQEDAIRWAVGAKVNAPYANVGLQYGRDKGTVEDSTEKDYINSSYLALTATGGDTLLGVDIPKWAPTIAPFKSWRVVKNEVALPIQQVIGAMTGWEHVPRLFDNIHALPSGRWMGLFSLWLKDEPLHWDSKHGYLGLRSACDKWSPKAIFWASASTTSWLDMNDSRNLATVSSASPPTLFSV